MKLTCQIQRESGRSHKTSQRSASHLSRSAALPIILKMAVERFGDLQKLERESGAERRRISPVDLWRPRQTALSPRSCEDPIRATAVLRIMRWAFLIVLTLSAMALRAAETNAP